MSPARAATRPVLRQAVAAPAPQTAPPRRRPDLRLVDPHEPSPRIRRRRAAVAGVGVLVLVFVVLFALAASQAVLAQNQQRLDRLERDVADEQARYQRLRLQVAELESPGRIVRAAQERLGMVPPPGTTYLSPSGAVADQLATAPGADDVPPDGPDDDGGTGTAGWATIKGYLGGGG